MTGDQIKDEPQPIALLPAIVPTIRAARDLPGVFDGEDIPAGTPGIVASLNASFQPSHHYHLATSVTLADVEFLNMVSIDTHRQLQAQLDELREQALRLSFEVSTLEDEKRVLERTVKRQQEELKTTKAANVDLRRRAGEYVGKTVVEVDLLPNQTVPKVTPEVLKQLRDDGWTVNVQAIPDAREKDTGFHWTAHAERILPAAEQMPTPVVLQAEKPDKDDDSGDKETAA